MSFLDRYFIKQPKLRRWVTRLLEGDRETDIALLGATLRVHSVKEHGYLRASRLAASAALLREEVPVLLNLAALLSDGDTFVDIGANVGVFSLTLARMRALLPRTRFYAFEANPDTFARLSAHAASSGIYARHLAISDHDGELDFIAGAVSHVFTTVANASSYSIPGATIRVPCRRLDGLDIEGDSLILKIDVEGQEQEVLDGATGLFRDQRIKAVYLDGYKERKVESFLHAHGFTLRHGQTLAHTDGAVFSLLALRATPASGVASVPEVPIPGQCLTKPPP